MADKGRIRHAVVLGGGLAGLLAATALTRHAQRVTVVERDRMPEGPQPRKGTPQARHAHMLMSSGAEAIDRLVPGFTGRLLGAGGHKVTVRTGVLSCTANGWLPREGELQYIITAGRPLLDWTLRELVLADERITLLEGVDVTGLTGDAQRVTGVTLRSERGDAPSELEADFVVDATGRGSSAPGWLARLGVPQVREEKVDTGLAYATREFKAPAALADLVVNVTADPGDARPGQAGALLPIEDGRWIVTLSGLKGSRPPTEEGEFMAFARGLRHPLLADLISAAEPIGGIHQSRSTVNRRRHYEELPVWPSGFLVVGDAAGAFNPVYGHGMSVAAKTALALRAALDRHGPHPRRPQALQEAVAAAGQDAWSLAVSQDQRYLPSDEGRPGLAARLLRRYMARFSRASASRPSVAAVAADLFTLSAPLSRVTAPKTVLATLLGPTRPPLTEPPLTESERKALAEVTGVSY
ncbi:FAD-dependent oxidoreductase [Streptomyces roseirectus]|uniref:FAD-dependent oxidoreductase n=1 Tax=Streptomyces roseirectus TaxID=2768066 RepID=A0A7H0IPZ5_9ACTN|nr:FAD-dependent oxidoreductase [Streptomyces roseirectus]QNP74861.1 FAD-dependent oxidoreductase [Streptomyces roseirectus]